MICKEPFKLRAVLQLKQNQRPGFCRAKTIPPQRVCSLQGLSENLSQPPVIAEELNEAHPALYTYTNTKSALKPLFYVYERPPFLSMCQSKYGKKCQQRCNRAHLPQQLFLNLFDDSPSSGGTVDLRLFKEEEDGAVPEGPAVSPAPDDPSGTT